LVRSTHAGTSALEAGLDMDYLTRIGAIHELPEWEALAGDVLSRQSVS
jgi:hypothetical protein